MPKFVPALREVSSSAPDFSHPHILISLQLDQGEEIQCYAYDQIIFEPFHACLSCNLYIHDHCMNVPRSLQHLSHPFHPLSLLLTPTYCSRSYTCNACGSEGRALGFSCAHCEFDLHVKCASLPNTILLDKHPHELKLIFDSPYENKNTIFACDLCRGIMQNNFWLDPSADYDFTAHLDCAVSKACFKEDKLRKPKESSKAKVLGNKKTRRTECSSKGFGKRKIQPSVQRFKGSNTRIENFHF